MKSVMDLELELIEVVTLKMEFDEANNVVRFTATPEQGEAYVREIPTGEVAGVRWVVHGKAHLRYLLELAVRGAHAHFVEGTTTCKRSG